jgi:hypothetical protein
LESTCKFAPDPQFESAVFEIACSNLKRPSNLDIFHSILNGLERFIIKNPEKPNTDALSILSIDLIKQENNLLAFGGLKSLNTSLYASNLEYIESTSKPDGVVQNEPEMIIKAIEDIELVFARIRAASPVEAKTFGLALTQIVNDLLPACEILTRLLKEFINSNQENIFVIAEIIHKVS